MWKLLCLATVAIAATATLACSGGDEQPTTSSSASAATSTKPPTSTTVPATAAPRTAAPSPDPAEAALAAAIKLVDGVAEADCTTNNPQQKDCVSLDPNHRAQASRGIAALGERGPAGGPSALFVGRQGNGDWGYYAGGQQFYQAWKLPGPMLACTQGSGLNVRMEPSNDASLVRTLEDNSTVTGEEFLLTQPGTPPPASTVPGYGWFRISAPVEGWVYSKYVSGLPECSFHDSVETP